MMNNVRRILLNIIAKIGWHSAIQSVGGASTFWYYQPEEPMELKNLNYMILENNNGIIK